jgi:hypothetical protein
MGPPPPPRVQPLQAGGAGAAQGPLGLPRPPWEAPSHMQQQAGSSRSHAPPLPDPLLARHGSGALQLQLPSAGLMPGTGGGLLVVGQAAARSRGLTESVGAFASAPGSSGMSLSTGGAQQLFRM